MTYNWSLLRKTSLIGLLLTGVGVFLELYIGWDEATIFCLVVGPFLLFGSLVLALFYVWMSHTGTSRLPRDWDELSLEEKHDFAEKQAIEQKKRLTLWLLRLNDSQRYHAKHSTKE